MVSSVTKVPSFSHATLDSSATTINSPSALDLSSCHTKYSSSKMKLLKTTKSAISNPCVNLPAQYSEFARASAQSGL